MPPQSVCWGGGHINLPPIRSHHQHSANGAAPPRSASLTLRPSWQDGLGGGGAGPHYTSEPPNTPNTPNTPPV